MPKPISSFGHCALHGEKESGAAWDRRDEGVTVQSCVRLGERGDAEVGSWVGGARGQRQRGLAL